MVAGSFALRFTTHFFQLGVNIISSRGQSSRLENAVEAEIKDFEDSNTWTLSLLPQETHCL